MPTSSSSPRSSARILSAAAFALSLALALAGCNDSEWPARDPVVVENAGADSVVFWPPLRYALPGDLLTAEIHGLKRVYACATVLQLNWTTVDSSAGIFLRPYARIRFPGIPDCPLSKGLDTTLEATAPAAGRKLFLRVGDSASSTDSLLVIAGTGVVEGFLHVTRTADTLARFSRFTFRDSTAGHPRRILSADSLSACEVLQAATYKRIHGSDTLSIRFRTLLANALPAADFPACAGVHADTVPVVPDRYQYP